VNPAPADAAAVGRAWQDAFNRADTAALVALYATDAMLLPPSGRCSPGGRVAASINLGGIMEGRTVSLHATHQRFRGEVGHVQGTWQTRLRGRTTSPLAGSGRYLMLFEREPDGQWSLVYHVWTADSKPTPRREDLPGES
jgi:ketosteroid isomerase-like protein